MTCLFCKGDMVNSTTTFTAELEHGIVIVKNVPCFKCDQCGEESFPFEVTVRLEKIIEHCRKMMQEVSIIDYSKVA